MYLHTSFPVRTDGERFQPEFTKKKNGSPHNWRFSEKNKHFLGRVLCRTTVLSMGKCLFTYPCFLNSFKFFEQKMVKEICSHSAVSCSCISSPTASHLSRVSLTPLPPPLTRLSLSQECQICQTKTSPAYKKYIKSRDVAFYLVKYQKKINETQNNYIFRVLFERCLVENLKKRLSICNWH